MSLTNHIIIPTIAIKQTLQQQNIFITSYLSLTPPKQQIPDLSFWKKSMSAFKKFKQKKDKKDKKIHPQNQQQDDHQQVNKIYYKLLKKRCKDESLYVKYQQYLQEYKYYDPNDAPLYQLQIQTNCQIRLKGINNIVIRPQKIDQEKEIYQIKIGKIQSQQIQEDIQHQIIIEPRDDDPFIIVKKDKKNNKNIKNKPIKKDKGRAQEKNQGVVMSGISLKNKSNQQGNSKSKDQHGHGHSYKNLGVTGSMNIIKDGQKDKKFNQSQNSSQENESNDIPLKLKKQMHTLQQIVKQANQKNNSQPPKLKKPQKQPPIPKTPQPPSLP